MKDVGVSKVVDAIIKNGKLPKFGFGGSLKKKAKSAAATTKQATKSLGSKLDPTDLFKQSKDVIAEKAMGFVEDMLKANALAKGGTAVSIKGYANGGLIDDRVVATQKGEFVLQKPTVDAIGPDVVSSINKSGKLQKRKH